VREILEHLLQSVDVPNVERAQLHWDEYRTGAASSDPAVKAAADAAFATLLAWYGGSLYRHIWGFIRSDAAEDVFQNVLRKLHEKRLSSRLADFHANVLPWLRTVAIRECVDAHRRTTRRRAREARTARPEDQPQFENLGELQEVLTVALGRLTREEQQAIALHYFEGHDKQAAAAILGVNRDTLTSRLTSALTRLQKFVPSPAGILVGGTLTAPAALTAKPPALTAARLGELVAAAWDKATEAGWLTGRAAAAAMIGLALCGVAAAAGWALTNESRQPEEVRTPPPAVSLPREPLRERYIRITKAEVIPRALAAIQKLLPPDNRISAQEPRVNGSTVEVEFRPARQIPNYFTDRVLVRYDVLTGKLFVNSLVVAEGKWYPVGPDQPYTVHVPTFEGWKTVTTTPFRSAFAEVHDAFRLIPHDDRAEEEQVRYLFGEHGWTGREFTIPSTAYYVFGNSRTLFVWFSERGDTFARRIDGGGWRSAGILPHWHICVDDTHFYYAAPPDHLLARRIDDPQGSWAKVGTMTGRIKPEAWVTAAHGKLFYRGSGPTVLTKATHNPDEPWTELPEIPSSWRGLASAGGRLFSGGEATVYELPLNRADAKWQPSRETLPPSRFLAVWGDRVLHIPEAPGHIRSRSASDPDAPWEKMGHVHVPQE
jgi:RNA polymerase sigma factor (sigma-70 family)